MSICYIFCPKHIPETFILWILVIFHNLYRFQCNLKDPSQKSKKLDDTSYCKNINISNNFITTLYWTVEHRYRTCFTLKHSTYGWKPWKMQARHLGCFLQHFLGSFNAIKEMLTLTNFLVEDFVKCQFISLLQVLLHHTANTVNTVWWGWGERDMD